MTSHMMTPDLLRDHLSDARDAIAADKLDLLAGHSLPPDFNREAYGFAYLQAERYGMRIVDRKLAGIEGLPLQLDTRAEIMEPSRPALKHWLKGSGTAQPDAEDFGNDYIHALARAALVQGWDTGATQKLAARIGNLFRDLSCLIGLVYYCGWLDDHGVARFPLVADGDMPRMVAAAGAVVQSVELARQRQAEEQARHALAGPAEKRPPRLQLIANPAYQPPPAPV